MSTANKTKEGLKIFRRVDARLLESSLQMLMPEHLVVLIFGNQDAYLFVLNKDIVNFLILTHA